jgi:flavin-dependent dehydrogenase
MEPSTLKLNPDSKVAVVGGGPAGSFFAYFILTAAERLDLGLRVDIYEPRDFSRAGPPGCNMCGGIISESLVQMLSTEGILLPPTIVQRGIDSYMLHTDAGSVRIDTPLQEKRIGAVYRGSGPRDIKGSKWGSFDGHLQELAVSSGAQVIQDRVSEMAFQEGMPQVGTRKRDLESYDLLAVATGVNSSAERLFADTLPEYGPPKTTKTFIQEYFLGESTIERVLGSSMHVFLLDIPRLEFAAIIPKGDYASVCLLGEDIDSELVQEFLAAPEVVGCMPKDWDRLAASCRCSPRINTSGASQPYADRLVFIGDSGVTRLYKDGIGAAFRTAKAAAMTAVFQGVAASDFQMHYAPACARIESDNRIGKLIFAVSRQFQRRGFARQAVLNMTADEQQQQGSARRMSTILWDLFTGSAPYREILNRALHPGFWLSMTRALVGSLIRRSPVGEASRSVQRP